MTTDVTNPMRGRTDTQEKRDAIIAARSDDINYLRALLVQALPWIAKVVEEHQDDETDFFRLADRAARTHRRIEKALGLEPSV